MKVTATTEFLIISIEPNRGELKNNRPNTSMHIIMAISKTQKAEMMCMISEMRLNDELMIGFSRLLRFIHESDLFSSRAYKIA